MFALMTLDVTFHPQMKLMQSIQSRLDDLKMQVGTKNEDTLQTLQETEDKINKQITEL